MTTLPTATRQWVFAKGGYEYGNAVRVIDDSPITKASTGESPASNYVYQGNSYQGERRLDLEGFLQADTQALLESAWDTFMSYHQAGPTEQFFMRGNRWIWAAVDGHVPRKWTNYRSVTWQCSLLCGDPYYYQAGLQEISFPALTNQPPDSVGVVYATSALTVPGVGGTAFSTPYLSFTCSAITYPGVSYFEITNTSTWCSVTGRVQKFRFYPQNTSGAEQFRVYFGPNCTPSASKNRTSRHKVERDSDGTFCNKWRQGGELTLVPGTNTFTISAQGITFSEIPALHWYARFI